MQIKFLRLIAALACVSLFIWSCTKIDSTVLGEDLIAVDNVSTFDTILSIDAVREQIIDTTRLSHSEIHVLGNINNDPVFGKTKADIFLQLKPTFFPFYFGNAKDTINPSQNVKTHFDSAFLCFSYTGFYGDTTRVQHFKVYKLDENTTNFTDTLSHLLSFQPDMPYLDNLIGEADVYEPNLKNYIFLNTSAKDSVTKQIRIKLNSAFLSELVSGDSSVDNIKHFFHSDSLFREKYKGFAVVADGGNDANGLFYVNLTEEATRLEVHYVATNAGKLDTAFSSFPLSPGASANIAASATANFLKRDTSSSEFPNNPDMNALYVQSAPGSAIRLKIPALSTFPNSIIHRAEVILDQALPRNAIDEVLRGPSYLYLDLVDDTSSSNKYKPVYYDLSPNEFYTPDSKTSFFPTDVDNSYYGGYIRSLTDGSGTRSYYSFNLTRYVQNLVTKRGTNYKLRVYAPYNLTYYGLNLQYKNSLAYGRIKLYNGNDPKYRIRMRIVYSKI